MRVLAPLALALLLTASPALAAAPYTDHYGTWTFTGLGPADAGTGVAQESVLLRLKDGSGFTAFIPVVPTQFVRTLGYQVYRPPMMAFECYSEQQTGNLVLRGQLTQVAGSCTQAIEVVEGEQRFVVRFVGYQVPIRGVGVYCVQAAPAHC